MQAEGWLEADGSSFTPRGREQFLRGDLSATSPPQGLLRLSGLERAAVSSGGKQGRRLLIHLESKGWIQRVAGFGRWW
jgi:hypothetical protein